MFFFFSWAFGGYFSAHLSDAKPPFSSRTEHCREFGQHSYPIEPSPPPTVAHVIFSFFLSLLKHSASVASLLNFPTTSRRPHSPSSFFPLLSRYFLLLREGKPFPIRCFPGFPPHRITSFELSAH